MFCGNCGDRHTGGQFCGKCGHALNASTDHVAAWDAQGVDETRSAAPSMPWDFEDTMAGQPGHQSVDAADTQLALQPVPPNGVGYQYPRQSNSRSRAVWPVAVGAAGLVVAVSAGAILWSLYGDRLNGKTASTAPTASSTTASSKTSGASPSTVVTVTESANNAVPSGQSSSDYASASQPASNADSYQSGASITAGTWITILDNMPSSDYSYSDAVDRAASYGGQVEVVHSTKSSDFAQKNVWVLFVPDQSSRSQAVSLCGSYNRPVGDCYPKYMSSGT